MATTVTDLSQADIDRLLQEAEDRLSAKPEKNVVAVATPTDVELVSSTTSVVAPGPLQVKAAQKAGKDMDVRVPTLPQKKDKNSKDDAGANWFHMPKTKLTPELKRDLQLIRLRSVLDRKVHFRKDTRKDFIPSFSQVGTIVDGTLDAHSSGRLTRKEKKRTIVEEVLGASENDTKFKARYGDIQTRKMSGRKGQYKKFLAQRKRRG